MSEQDQRLTVPAFSALKTAGQKISVLTAYDFAFARLLDEAGIEGILVGDTLSMVVQGHKTTLPVTLDEMIYHARIVGRAVRRALTIVDLPFPYAHLEPSQVIEASARVLKETGCQAVKLEGGAAQAGIVAALVEAGIPVMGHVGLRPQNIRLMGRYRVQRDATRLMHDARAVEQAGAFSIVLECIPAGIAANITEELRIPTIGIGAGAQCDGQVLVIHDLLGLTPAGGPRFVKQYADLSQVITSAVSRYRDEVRSGRFPAAEHAFQ